MGHLRLTIGYLKATVVHIRVTLCHLRVTLGHLRATIGYLRITIRHLRVTIGYFFLQANLRQTQLSFTPSKANLYLFILYCCLLFCSFYISLVTGGRDTILACCVLREK